MTSQELDTLILRLNALYHNYTLLNEERMAIQLEFGQFLDQVCQHLGTSAQFPPITSSSLSLLFNTHSSN